MSDDTKPAAKKAVKANKTPVKGLTDREGDIVALLTVHRSRMSISMLQRKRGSKNVFFPRDMDDVASIIMIQKCYNKIISLDDMKGFCKIWDEIIEKWSDIEKLHDAGNGREMKSFLKNISDPYASNLATGDYSGSIYG